MGFILRLPSITAFNDSEKIEQMRTYLYQNTKDIEYALNTLDSTTAKTAIASEIDANSIFSQIKPMIIRSSDIINSYYDIMKDRLEDVFVDSTHYVVPGIITSFAEQLNCEYLLIATDENTTGLPENFGVSVGDIHRFNETIVVKLTDTSTGKLAVNTYSGGAWQGWKYLIPE